VECTYRKGCIQSNPAASVSNKQQYHRVC